MKSRTKVKILLLSILAIMILSATVILKYVFLTPFYYENNSTVSKQTNYEIKNLVLKAIKQRYSAFSQDTESNIYTDEYASYLQNSTEYSKGVFIRLDRSFMNTLEKHDENNYIVSVQMIWPDDYNYHFTIINTDNKMKISDVQINP